MHHPGAGELVEKRRLRARRGLAELLEDVGPLGELGRQSGCAGEIGLLRQHDQELALTRGREHQLIEHPRVDLVGAAGCRRLGEQQSGGGEQEGFTAESGRALHEKPLWYRSAKA